MIEETLSQAEAQRFYDRYGRRLEWSEPFEGRAKERAFAAAAVRPGEAVVEVGLGTGRFLAHAVGAGAAPVVGVDLSPTMLGLSAAHAPAARLVRASAVRLPLADEAFDLVFTSYTLDLLPRRLIEPALREVRRVLRPEGRAVLCGLTEGRSLLEKTVMGLWKGIHRLAPARVGGCRPVVLAPFAAAAGLRVVEREHVGQLGTPSEVVVARRPDR